MKDSVVQQPQVYERHRWLNSLVVSLVIFLVLFPKGGVKVGDTPITWGYLLLGLSVPPALLLRMASLPLVIRPSALVAFATAMPFQILMLYSIRANGYFGTGILFSNLSGFFLFPFLFLLIYPAFLPAIDPERFLRWLRFCILAAALWGIFLFLWRPLFGYYIEIPLLTVNLGDYGQLEATKHIDRGAFFKLISTYNNGNVYGVATLILFPLYKVIEPSRWKKNTIRLALVLTLSRTVWLGLVIEQLLSTLVSLPSMIAALPRIYTGLALRRFGALLLTFGIVFIGFLFSVQSLSFLADRSLGGREAQFAAFSHPALLPSIPMGGFAEVMYSSALLLFGATGLVAIVLLFLSPVLLALLFPKLVRFPTNRAAAKGLLLYAIVAGADGSTNLIPVLAFYWFMYMIFLYGLPGEQRGGVLARWQWERNDNGGSKAPEQAVSYG